ncbi:hypothetical protein N5J70_21320, partial [Pseudomonas sp. GD03909]|nr:hypothetical protein [Pseudomonas sp. GD03909]
RKPCNPHRLWSAAIFHRDFPRRNSLKITMETDSKVRKEMATFSIWLTPLKAAPLLGFSHFPS